MVAFATQHDATRDFCYSPQWQCVEERVTDVATSTTTLDRQYIWGLRYVDDLVRRDRDTTGNGTLDETLYALSDRQFNVIALWDPDAGTSGEVVERFCYTPYGGVQFLNEDFTTKANTGYAWTHLFQGLPRDPATGLTHNRARELHSLLGRFLQRDPLGYPDGLNAYAAYHVMWAGTDASGTNAVDTNQTNRRTETAADQPQQRIPGRYEPGLGFIPDHDDTDYNCAGCAFETFRWHSLSKTEEILNSICTKLDGCELECDCGDRKCWMWVWEYWLKVEKLLNGRWVLYSYDQQFEHDRPKIDFHIACAYSIDHDNDPETPCTTTTCLAKTGIGGVRHSVVPADEVPQDIVDDVRRGGVSYRVTTEHKLIEQRTGCFCCPADIKGELRRREE